MRCRAAYVIRAEALFCVHNSVPIGHAQPTPGAFRFSFFGYAPLHVRQHSAVAKLAASYEGRDCWPGGLAGKDNLRYRCGK